MPSVDVEIVRGQTNSRLRRVTSPVYLIGHSSQCDLTLGDSQFPDVYAYLYVTETGVSFRRLSMGPEVTVDRRPIESAELFHKDRLRMGPYEFRLHVRWRPLEAAERESAKTPPLRVVDDAGCGMLEAMRSFCKTVRRSQGSKPPLSVFHDAPIA